MRLLLSVLLFFFSQVISLQKVQGKGVDFVNACISKSNFSTKKFYFKPISKNSASLKKAFLDDLTFINHHGKHQSISPWFFLKGPEKQQYIPQTFIKVYHLFQNFSYEYIFDFLYPKHVFW